MTGLGRQTRVARAKYPRARIYQSVRTAHLERAHELSPASIYFQVKRYDFDAELADGLDLINTGRAAMAWSLLRSGVCELEVNEPLMRAGVASGVVAIAAVRLSARLRGKPSRVVSYAIENRSPFAQTPGASTRSRVRAAVEVRLARLVARQLDHIAYGTAGSAELYEAELGYQLRGAAADVVTALPSACDCLSVATGTEQPASETVLFLGAFSARKGIGELMMAWPDVLRARPQARLQLIGKGQLQPEVLAFAAEHDSVEVLLDPPRTQIHAALRAASVLVLLSQPAPHWREQVGLPIIEALAHGCRVVTTTETGLAEWLSAHGHPTFAADSAPTTVAAVIGGLLQQPANARRSEVLGTLPSRDSRLAADDLLFAN
jgi:glycosyltransferase involved in cell wall biosynthesis